MKYIPVFFFLFLFAACTDDKPAGNNGADTPQVVTTDTNSILVDTIVTADGKQILVKHDCSILKKRIPSDSELDQLQYDLQELGYCVDSFDFRYVVPNLLSSWLSEERVKGNATVTYNDFIVHLDEFKTTEAYSQLHMQITTLDSLRSTPFDANKIAAMRETFGKLGMTEPEWNAFSGFARTYPVPPKSVFTWGDMMDAFEAYYSQYNEGH
ncbi:MAG TPA: hypothetical protein VK826_11140 [Bacteroidia bacterium]|nr:hypothetical protein [Bacteroidia bacterium]